MASIWSKYPVLKSEVTVAPENGAIMAGRKGPAMWLRYGPLPAQWRQI
jgi:hypothetical protein